MNFLHLHSIASLVTVSLLTLTVVPVVHARTLNWSGYDWLVKTGNGRGPGPNDWSDSTQSVWVDAADDLHLKIRQVNGNWFTSEVTNTLSLGYGRYEFRMQTDFETLDRNVVAGLFAYENDEQEIDIEFSKWGDANAVNSQYAVQPYDTAGNRHRFDTLLDGTFTTQSFVWAPDSITFASVYGHYSTTPPGVAYEEWTYTGDDIPVATTEKAIINFWLFQGRDPANGLEQELILDSFTFTPLDQLVPEPTSLTLASLSALLATRRPSRRRKLSESENA